MTTHIITRGFLGQTRRAFAVVAAAAAGLGVGSGLVDAAVIVGVFERWEHPDHRSAWPGLLAAIPIVGMAVGAFAVTRPVGGPASVAVRDTVT